MPKIKRSPTTTSLEVRTIRKLSLLSSKAEIEFRGFDKLNGVDSRLCAFAGGMLSGVRSLVLELEGAAATRASALDCYILSGRFDYV